MRAVDGGTTPPRGAHSVARGAMDPCAVVLLEASPDLGPVALAALTALLADAVASLFGETAVVLRLGGRGGPPTEPAGERVGVRTIELATPADGTRAEVLVRAAVERCMAAGVHRVFVDASPLGAITPPWLTALATQRVHLTRDEHAPLAPPRPGCALLRTVLLAPRAGGPRLAPEGMRASRVLGQIARDLVCGAAEPDGWGAPYADGGDGSPSWCRVAIDLSVVARARSFRALPEGARETFGRWARALTRRRVGLALGGSGAWGYASVALILELCARGVPVDLVAGASSGALLGAYYCAAGVEGLARAIANGPEFERGMALMTLSSAAVQHAVDAELGAPRLGDLEVPLLPVATNLALLRPEVILGGTVGLGVRASASAPGLFAPTVMNGTTYVDGAVTDNVPVGLAEAMGADLVVATNPLPPAVGPRPRDGAFGPLRRLRDLAVSFDLMLHRAGERAPHSRRIVYSAGPAASPLQATFGYRASARIVDEVRSGDPRFRAAVDAAVEAWHQMMLPRPAPGAPAGHLATNDGVTLYPPTAA